MATVARLNVLLSANAKDFEKKITTAERKLAQFGRNASKIGRTLTTSVTAPLLLVGAASVKMAAAAEESESLFEVSMGNMAASARQYSETLRKELGLNAYEVRRNIGTFNQMFTAMRIGEDRAYDMATSLSKLSADMASFFDLRPEDAFQKLQAGITGEAEPLKRLGILIDEQTIKQAALRAGIIKSGETMTQQQKVFARYYAIMEQTTNAQGDLARTFDSTTNRMKRFQARVEETAIELGQKLVPAFEVVLSVAAAFVSVVGSLVSAFSSLPKWIQNANIGLVALGLAVGPVIWGVGSLATAVGSLTKAFRLLAGTAAIRGVIALLLNPWVAVFAGAVVATGALSFALWKLHNDASEAKDELKSLSDGISLGNFDDLGITDAIGKLAAARAKIQSQIEETKAELARVTPPPLMDPTAPAARFTVEPRVAKLNAQLDVLNGLAADADAKLAGLGHAASRIGEDTTGIDGLKDDLRELAEIKVPSVAALGEHYTFQLPIEYSVTELKEAVLRAPVFIQEWVSTWPMITVPIFWKFEKPEQDPASDPTPYEEWVRQTTSQTDKAVSESAKRSAQLAQQSAQIIGGAIINGIVYGIKDGADFLKAILASILSSALSAGLSAIFAPTGILGKLFASVQTKVDFAPITMPKIDDVVLSVVPELQSLYVLPFDPLTVDVVPQFQMDRFAPVVTPKFDDVVLSVVPELQPLFVPAFDPLMVDVVPQFQMGRFAPEMGPNVLELDTTASYNMTNSPIVDVEPPRIEVVVNTYPSLFANPSEAARDPQAQVFIRDAMSRAKYQGYR